MAARRFDFPAVRITAVALGLFACTASIHAAELVGRVVDAVDARVFGGAAVRLRGASAPGPAAQTDALGFFRFRDLAAGPYLVDVALPDGRTFLARVVLLPGRKSQFLELDYARAVPPDDDDDY
jgi:hypothetical protein